MRASSHADLLHEHSHDQTCACGEHHSHAQTHFLQTAIGVILVSNSFLYEWMFERNSPVAGFSAMFGAILLAMPIVWVAFKDVRAGSLNTNVLVALAVLALFASGHYQEAGIVSFFMLLGQIIEARTAEGALESIRSLIKLTPTKARRVTARGPVLSPAGGTSEDAVDFEEEVAVHKLTVGDTIRVRPGDNVAADGVIVNGRGSFNEANITGESLPVDRNTTSPDVQPALSP